MSEINKDKYDHGPKSFGMSARTSWFDSGDRTLPGPGTHENIRMNKTNPPLWGTGTATERNSFLDKYHFQYPPSNNYNPKFQVIKPQQPKYSIPEANDKHSYKHIDENNSLLYHPDYHADKVQYPQYTMGYFQEIDYRTCTPSPNQYHKQTQKDFFNKTQNSFTVSNRPLPYGENGKFPGPASYMIENYKQPSLKYSVGQGERPEVINGKDAPLIFYQIAGDLRKSGGGKTVGMQYPVNDQKNQDFPPPNQYTPLYIKSKQNVITTYANRSPLQNVAVLKYPSPQKYSTQTDFYRRKSYSFTKDTRDRSYIIKTPGPGTHQVDAQLNTTSGVMGKKLKQQGKLITPAANNYKPNTQFVSQSSPRVINFYSNRVDFSKSLTGKQVGPGSYNLNSNELTRAQLGKISKSMKFAKQANKNPGPGSYYIPSSIGKLPKYYSGAKKTTQDGFSTFTLKMWQKQRQQQKKQSQLQQKQIKQQEQQQQEDVQNNNSSQVVG